MIRFDPDVASGDLDCDPGILHGIDNGIDPGIDPVILPVAAG